MQQYQTLERKLDEVEEILNENYCRHDEEVQMIENKYQSHYSQWMFYLREQFNLLLYGVGSKTSVINKFCSIALKDCCVLTVQGYNPQLSLRDVVRSLIVDVFGKASCPLNVDQAVSKLKHFLKSSHFPIFLIIHNIDGIGLRALKRQETLSKLANLPNLHLIASVDHNKSPLLWGEKMLSKFNFVWIDVTTYRHYLRETWNKQVLKTETSEADDHDIRVFARIYYCCSDKIRKIVRIIIEDRLKNERHEQSGLNLQSLHTRAQEEMLLSHQNLKSLDNLLKDFCEHGVMKKITSNCLVLTVNKDALAKFYESEFATDK